MIKIYTILIDDEQHNLYNLQSLLKKYCRDVEIVGMAQNADEALSLIIEKKPNLLFLDIEMPEKSGFDLLNTLPPDYLGEIEVIFVTAHDQYGIPAIKFSAIDYLLKPLNTAELQTAVNKAANRIGSRQKNKQMEILMEILDQKVDRSLHRIALPSLRENRLVLVQDILRCESSNNYTNFFLTTREEILISKPIYEYEELLNQYDFIRCHQSHLVNSRHVVSLIREDGGYLKLSDGTKIPIARQRKDEVRKILGL